MNYLTVGKENSCNIDIYYEDHGTGKPVVLIHGLAAEWSFVGKNKYQSFWLQAAGSFHTTEGDSVNSSKPTSGYDYDTFAEDLNKLILTLDLHNAMLVGFSMGAARVSALFGQSTASKRVERVVFLSSVPPFLIKKTPDNPAE